MSMKSSPPIEVGFAGAPVPPPPPRASANRSSVASSTFGCLVFVSIITLVSMQALAALHHPSSLRPHPCLHVRFDRIALLFHPRAALVGFALGHEHIENRVRLVAIFD